MNDASLIARWRRFGDRLDQLRSAATSGDESQTPDAVAGVLESLNDLWEHWLRNKPLPRLHNQDNFVRGDIEGETTAALIFARGAKTHLSREFGDFTDTYADRYADLYGVWRWQAYADSNPRYRQRNDWFAQHVTGREVMPPMEAAARWLHRQPELRR